MARTIEDILDEALFQQWHNGSEPDSLPAGEGETELLRPLLATARTLELLLPVSMPGQSDLDKDREQFLRLLAESRPPSAVSHPVTRLKGWLARHLPQTALLSRQREHNRMSMLAFKATFLLIATLASAGGTAVLAADSLPDSTLYPLKLTIEEARLSLARTPVDQAMLQIQFADERMGEIHDMVQDERLPGDEIMVSLQDHLDQALILAAQTPDETMSQLLVRAREVALAQEQLMGQALSVVGEGARAMLQQTVQLMDRVREICDDGLTDPQAFRAQFGQRAQNRWVDHQETPGRGAGPGPGDCQPGGDCDPVGDQHQVGPGPGDAGHHGPVPDECTLADDCDPAGEQHRVGPGQDVGRSDPTLSACPSGNECDPAGDQNQYGPGNTAGEPHGSGFEACLDPDECDPYGDQNRHGPGSDMEMGGPRPGDGDGSGDRHEGGGHGPGPGNQEQDPPHSEDPPHGSGGGPAHGGGSGGDGGGSDQGGGSGNDDGGDPGHGGPGGGGSGGRGG